MMRPAKPSAVRPGVGSGLISVQRSGDGGRPPAEGIGGEHEVDATLTARRIAPVTAGRWRRLPRVRAVLPWRSDTVLWLRSAVTVGCTVAAFGAILVAFL